MGHKKQLDVSAIAGQINTAAYECMSPYNDGFIAWGYKQDLYMLREILDNAIRRCPTFAPEEEWLREQEKKKVVRILKDDL